MRSTRHKSLYSDSFYTREEFDELYGGETYNPVKKAYDPDSRLLDLYAKAVPATMTTDSALSRDLEIFTATGQHPLKFTAYDSTAGQDDATGLDLRTSPAAPPTSYRSARMAWPRLCVR